jgi:hypothetical protein
MSTLSASAAAFSRGKAPRDQLFPVDALQSALSMHCVIDIRGGGIRIINFKDDVVIACTHHIDHQHALGTMYTPKASTATSSIGAGRDEARDIGSGPTKTRLRGILSPHHSGSSDTLKWSADSTGEGPYPIHPDYLNGKPTVADVYSRSHTPRLHPATLSIAAIQERTSARVRSAAKGDHQSARGASRPKLLPPRPDLQLKNAEQD